MKKRMLIVFFGMLAACFMMFQIYGAEIYTDLNKDHWAYNAIEAMSETGIISGYPDGSFKPDQVVTYGEFIKMLVAADSEVDPDVSQTGHWASAYYREGLDRMLFQEHKIPESSLDRKIPRGYMAYILSCGLGDFSVDNYVNIKGEISDVEANHPFEYDIIKAYSKDILTGYPDGSFRPEGTLSRAEAAIVLHNYVTVKNGGTVEKPEIDGDDFDQEQKGHGDSVPEENWTNSEVGNLDKKERDWSDLETLCTDFHAMNPVYEIAENWDETLIWNNEGRVTSCAPQIQYYEILQDCPYDFQLSHNKAGSKNIKLKPFPGGVDAVLIQNKKVMMFESDFGKGELTDVRAYGKLNSTVGEEEITYYPRWKDANYEIPVDFDYIGFFVSTGDTLICIPNPFDH